MCRPTDDKRFLRPVCLFFILFLGYLRCSMDTSTGFIIDFALFVSWGGGGERSLAIIYLFLPSEYLLAHESIDLSE